MSYDATAVDVCRMNQMDVPLTVGSKIAELAYRAATFEGSKVANASFHNYVVNEEE